MKIGLLQVDLHLESCNSLKDKRSVLKSLKHRLRADYNVSVAEIGDHDVWRRSQFGLVAIGNSADSIERVFRSALNEIESRPEIEITDTQMEVS